MNPLALDLRVAVLTLSGLPKGVEPNERLMTIAGGLIILNG